MRETDLELNTEHSGSESEELPIEDDINQMATPDHLSLSESTSNQAGIGSVIQISPLKGYTVSSKMTCCSITTILRACSVTVATYTVKFSASET